MLRVERKFRTQVLRRLLVLAAGLFAPIVMAAAIAATPAPAATIVVDSVDDPAPPSPVDGNCTLREAIASVAGPGKDTCESGSDPAADTIVFDDLGPGNHLVDAYGGFIINSPVTIDATVLAGELRIDGDGAPGPQPDFGLLPRASGTVLKGLTITRWSQTGVKVDTNNNGSAPADGVQVLDSFIGTDEAGSSGLGNGSLGISIGGGAGPEYQPDATVIRGNVVSGNANGLSILGEGTDNTLVAENLIGTTPVGNAALSNSGFGISISEGADSTTIGGPATGEGNVISGNGSTGLGVGSLTADAVSGTTIQNNRIGLGADGSTPLGNSGIGLLLNGTVNNTSIAANSIAANASAGIQLTDSAAGGVDSTTITGNRIGTDQAGTSLHANSDAIILTAPSGPGIANTTIGGPRSIGGNCVAPCNVIAGGRVLVNSSTVVNTDIIGNHVGVDFAGTTALNEPVPENRIELNYGDDSTVGTPAGPNVIGGGNNGIKVDGTYTGEATIRSNWIGIGAGTGPDVGVNNAAVLIQGADGVVVGGTSSAEGNRITNNGNGVQVDTQGTDNPIIGNSIYRNGGLGIDLFDVSGGGVTPNDVGDLDTGSNDLQNYPEIEIVAGGQTTRVIGRFNSTNTELFRLEFFASSEADDSGYGEGERFLGFSAVTGTGAAQTFDVELPEATSPGEVVTATATRIDGGVPKSTSEFSEAAPVDSCGVNAQAVGAIVGTNGDDPLNGTTGDDVICGLVGDDTIAPGPGNDTVIGGPGADAVDHSGSAGPVEVNLLLGTSTGEGNKFLRGIEGANGSDLNDEIIGNAARNRINGGGGADSIDGGQGPDLINGQTGNDSLAGSGGNDRIEGKAGKDEITGGAGKDTLVGGAGPDRLKGGASRDRLFGKVGRDLLLGGGGNDLLNAGGGSRDVARGGAGRDTLAGGPGRRDVCDGGGKRDKAKRSCEKLKRIP